MEWGNFYRKQDINIISHYIGNIWGSQVILEEITTLNPKKILEVGCGPGLKSIFLSHVGYDVTVADNDKKIIDLVKYNNSLLKGNIDILKHDAFSLPFKDKVFDVIFNEGFFEHFNDPEIHSLMREFLRVAHYVIFTVPSYYHPQQDFGDERLLKKEEWERILGHFKLIKAMYFKYQPSWHSKINRIKEILFRIILHRDITKPRSILIVVSD